MAVADGISEVDLAAVFLERAFCSRRVFQRWRGSADLGG